MLQITFLASGIWKWLLEFWKICGPSVVEEIKVRAFWESPLTTYTPTDQPVQQSIFGHTHTDSMVISIRSSTTSQCHYFFFVLESSVTRSAMICNFILVKTLSGQSCCFFHITVSDYTSKKRFGSLQCSALLMAPQMKYPYLGLFYFLLYHGRRSFFVPSANE